MLLAELSDRGWREAFSITVAVACILVPSIYLISIKLGSERGDFFLTLNIQRGLVIFPLFCVLGWWLYDSVYRDRYARAYVLLALTSSAIAFVERAMGHSLLGRDESFDLVTRDGQVRAVAGAEHVLVLGTLICVAAAFVAVSTSGFKVPLGVLLVAGCWSTGSLGPTVIAAAALVVGCTPAIQRSLKRHVVVYLTGAWAALVLLAYMSSAVWSMTIHGATGRSFSTEYRYALYASIPSILKENPIGIGIGKVPSGVWQFTMAGFQSVDVARSIDSELVHLAIMFGIIGIAAYVWLLMTSLRVLSNDFTAGLPMIALCSVGLVLSLHSWDTLTPVWFIGIGLIAHSRRNQRRGMQPHDPRARGLEQPQQPFGARSMRDIPLPRKI